jgi:hypothetical protein
MQKRFINIDVILEDIREDYGFQVTRTDVLRYVWKFIGYVLTPDMFIPRSELVDIEDYRGILPNDFFELNSENSIYEFETKIPLSPNRSNTSNFYEDVENQYTYQIRDRYIITDIETTTLIVDYIEYPMDLSGAPLIPDNAKAVRAITDFVAERLAKKLKRAGVLSEREYEDIRQESYFSTASFMSSSKLPNQEQMDKIMNRSLSLISDPRQKSFNHNLFNNRLI